MLILFHFVSSLKTETMNPFNSMQLLSQSFIQKSFLFSSLFQVSLFYVIKINFAETNKQVSWILTLLSSLVCTVISIPCFIVFWRSGWNMAMLSIDSSLHIGLVCFFITYLVLDLSFGLVYYRQRITVLTGWIHHPLYIVVLFWLLKSRSSSFFSTACLLEVPTLLLALGSFRNRWRCDFLFASIIG
ncbi:hypothetical protein BY458DRAFT_523506 [Sporodiniella umbellata]|nr:hypothetical protein BY458DRAFT_523506 [Sporodiniella umbellata]